MNKLSILFISLLFFGQLFAQEEKNWLDFNNKYLKIKINQDGIYELNSEILSKYGFSKNNNIVIYFRGKKINTQLLNLDQNQFSIRFFGRKNIGDLDSLVYEIGTKKPNPYYSLFSDDSYYFLTEENTGQKKIEEKILTESSNNNLFKEEDLYLPNSQYTFNNNIGLLPVLMQSYFEAGETWSGPFVSFDSTYNFNFKLSDPSASKINIELGLNGRSQTQHLFKIFQKDSLLQDSVKMADFGPLKKSFNLTVPKSGIINLNFRSLLQQKFDWYSITYARFNYLKKWTNERNRKFKTHDNVYVNDLNLQHWDITIPETPVILKSNKIGSFSYLENKTVWISDKILKPELVEEVKFSPLPKNVEYLIITDKKYQKASQEFMDYRASEVGGKFKCAMVFTSDLYDQYFYGEKSPLAIKNYLNEAYGSQKRKFLLLIGKANTFPDILKNTPDEVPSFGYPASDLLLSTGPNYTVIPTIATGRLSVSSEAEILAYLDKVKEHESLSPEVWQKRGMHISGGQNPGELYQLKTILDDLKPNLHTQDISVLTKNKPNDKLVETLNITKEINEGLGFLTFAGHGSTSDLDYNFGFCSDPKLAYENKGKYPLMFFNGCGVGNVFYRYKVLSTDWLLTPKKGAIAVLANSYWSYAYPTESYLNALYDELYNQPLNFNLSIGEIQLKAIERQFINIKDPFIRANLHQVILQGDPAVKIFKLEKPEYMIKKNGIFIQSENPFVTIKKSKSITVGIFLENAGKISQKEVKIDINFFSKGIVSLKEKKNYIINKTTDTLLVSVETKDTDWDSLSVFLDSENTETEYLENNNKLTLNLVKEKDKFLNSSIYPEILLPDKTPPFTSLTFDDRVIESNGIVGQNSSVILSILDNQDIDLNSLKVYLKSCETCPEKEVKFKITNQNTKNFLEFKLETGDFPAGEYTIKVFVKDISGNSSNAPYEKKFIVLNNVNQEVKISASPNPSFDKVIVEAFYLGQKNPNNGLLEVLDINGKMILKKSLNVQVGKNRFEVSDPKFETLKGNFFLKFTIKDESGKELSSSTKIFKI